MTTSDSVTGATPPLSGPRGVAGGPEPGFGVADAARPSLRSRAIRGSLWTVGGYGASQVLRLGSNLVLTRLLFPEAFGLMALVNVLLLGVGMFSDVGIGPSIIRSKHGESAGFLNTAWTVQVVRGVLLSLTIVALAWPMSRFYDPDLFWLVIVGGLTALIAGFNSTSLFMLNRRLALGVVTGIELASQLLGILVMICVALLWHSVFALVLGGVAAGLLKMGLSHRFVEVTPNRLHWDRAAARELITFGKWIFVSTALTFLALQSDRLLLGALVPMGVLGVYSIGVMLARMPLLITSQLSAAVLFPAMSDKARRDPPALGGFCRRLRAGILPLALAVNLAVALLAPAFFRYLYDDRYADAGMMAQLVSLSVWFGLLQATVDRIPLALGDSRTLAASNFVKAVVTASGLLAGLSLAGIEGCIIGMAVGAFAGYVVVQVYLGRRHIPVLYQDLRYTAAFLLLAGGGVLTTKILSAVGGVGITGLVEAVIGVAIVGGVAMWAVGRLRTLLATT